MAAGSARWLASAALDQMGSDRAGRRPLRLAVYGLLATSREHALDGGADRRRGTRSCRGPRPRRSRWGLARSPPAGAPWGIHPPLVPEISRRRAVAFSGGAPGVFLSIALAVALLESSLVLLGVGNWLSRSDNDADLGGMPSETDLTVAVPYVLFGTASAFVSILFVLLLLAVAAWHLGVRPAGVAGREFP